MANSAPVFVSGGAGGVVLVSTSVTGEQGNSQSLAPTFSPDGTKVVFTSSASNLVPGDTNNTSDIFVKDLTTGAITRVSTDATGSQGIGASFQPVFSADGTKVVFSSWASNLVPDDTNNTSDIFVKDLTSGQITRVSTDDTGAQWDHIGSNSAVFSPDGTKVAFISAYTPTYSSLSDPTAIYLKDLNTGTLTPINLNAAGTQFGNGGSYNVVFSPDGTKVAFDSYADNLVAGDTNRTRDIFVKDLATGAITRVSTNAAGKQGDGDASTPIFSPDGTKVAFSSYASNLVPGDTNGTLDVFIKDLTTGAITRISTNSVGAQGNGDSYSPTFSPDGTKIAFLSSSSNFLDGSNDTGIYVKDLNTGAITKIGTAIDAGGIKTSHTLAFSPDGKKIVFASESASIIPGDSNHQEDIFTVSLSPISTTAATLTDDVAKASLSASGKVYFTDADSTDTHTVAIAPHVSGFGELTASVVPVANGPDHIDWNYSVNTDAIAGLGAGQSRTETFTLTLDDGHGGTVTQDVTITLNGINDAPVITSPGSVAFAENGTGPVLKIAASDPDGDVLSYSLSGADAALFTLAADGTLAFKSAPDYEAPDNARKDNVYALTLLASDGALTTSKALAVTVTDVAEGGGTPPLTGDDGANTLTGTSGNDTVHAGGGNDVVRAGAGSDTVYGDAGNDQLSGQGGGDLLDGGAGNDIAWGGDGDDMISGGDGVDMLYGENGNDSFDGGAGQDQLFGGEGNDRIFGGADGDMLYGENGDDVLDGGAGADQLFGGAGHNALGGGEGDDFLYAGWNGDRLAGGAGHDLVFGGAGADTFVLAGPQAANSDMFFNFTSGSDKVEIHGADYGLSAGALDAAHFQVGNAATGSAGTFVYNPTVGTLSWDADGAGSGASVTVATLIGGSLALGDLIVI